MQLLKAIVLMIVLFFVALELFLYIGVNKNSVGIKFTQQVPKEGKVLQKVFYIAGAVKSPGVYELEKGLRIADAIKLAKGLSNEADINYVNDTLNLAAIVNDEQHIFIPLSQENTLGHTQFENDLDRLVNINTASMTKLETLPGVGPSTAEKIIASRPYSKISDITNVSGIGESSYAKISHLITVD